MHPFYFADLKVVEGRRYFGMDYRYFGLDFGASNSYVVEFLSPVLSTPARTSYPDLRVSARLTERLRELEAEITKLRDSDLANRFADGLSGSHL